MSVFLTLGMVRSAYPLSCVIYFRRHLISPIPTDFTAEVHFLNSIEVFSEYVFETAEAWPIMILLLVRIEPILLFEMVSLRFFIFRTSPAG